MTSISGKNNLNWDEIAAQLAPVDVIDEPVLVKKRSRDFFWYSPILNAQLKRCFGDLVAVPKNREEMAHCLKIAYDNEIPVVLRGGGTGNYGQAVPLDGGLIIETTAMNQILEIGDGFVRAEAGALMTDINAALKPGGQEMAMFPSTQDIATVGGFVAGGSSGIGSLASGALREPGNIIALTVLSVDGSPQEHVFENEDVLKIHHAWGLNGVIVDVTLRTVPTRDWVACISSFETYENAYAAGYAVATAQTIAPKLSSVVDARIADYFPRLKGHVRAGMDLHVCYVPREDVEALKQIVASCDGHTDLAMDDQERQAAGIPHAFEFCYNHTTLQVLKSDRSATYQQIGVPDAADPSAITSIRNALGDDVWTHHEFFRYHGEVLAIDLPIIWFTDEARLNKINQTYSDHGFNVYDAHSNLVERGGLHSANFSHLAWKKRMDPKGLLNSGKSMAWEQVKHLSPEEIEAMEVG